MSKMKSLFKFKKSQTDLSDWNKADDKLVAAIEDGNIDKVESLLKKKHCSMNKVNDRGQTVVHIATVNGFVEAIQRMIAHQADICVPDSQGRTPLHIAARHGKTEIVEVLLKVKTGQWPKDDCQWTPLHHACLSGNRDCVQLLLKIQTPPDFQSADQEGKTPLFLAAQMGHTMICKDLIDRGVNVNATDNSCRTPLMYAAEHGNKETCEFLVKKGAVASIKDKLGRTAGWYALDAGHSDIKYILDRAPSQASWDISEGGPQHESDPNQANCVATFDQSPPTEHKETESNEDDDEWPSSEEESDIDNTRQQLETSPREVTYDAYKELEEEHDVLHEELRKLNEDYNVLKLKMAAMESADRLEATSVDETLVNSLQSEVKQLEEKLSQVMDDRTELKEEIEILQAKLSTYEPSGDKSENDSWGDSDDDLFDLPGNKRTTSALKLVNKKSTVRLTTAPSENGGKTDLEKELEELRKENSQLKSEALQNSTEGIAHNDDQQLVPKFQYDELLKAADEDRHLLRVKINELETQNLDLSQKVGELEGESYEELCLELTNENDELKEQVAELEEKIAEYESSSCSQMREEDKGSEVVQLRETVARQQKELAHLKTVELEEQRNYLSKSDNSLEVDELKETILNQERTIGKLKQIESQRSEMEVHICELKNDLATHEQMLTSVRSVVKGNIEQEDSVPVDELVKLCITKLSNKNHEITNSMQTMEQELDRVNSTISSEKEAFCQKEAEFSNIKISLENEIEELSKVIADQKVTLADVQSRADDELSALSKTVDEQKQKMSALQTSLDKVHSEMTVAVTQHKEELRKVEADSESNSKLELTSLQQSLESDIEQLTSVISEQKITLADVQRQADVEISTLSKAVDEQKQLIATLQSSMNQAQSEMSTIVSQHKEEISCLKEQLESNSKSGADEVNDLQETNNVLRSQVKQHEREIDSLRQRSRLCDELDTTNATLKLEVQALQNKLDVAISNNDTVANRLKSENNDLIVDRDQMKAIVDKLRASAVEKNEEFENRLSEVNQTRKSEMFAMETQMDELKSEIKKKSDLISELKVEHDKQWSELSSNNSVKESLESELKNLQSKVEGQAKQIVSMETRCKQQEFDLEERWREMEESKVEKKKLEEEVGSLGKSCEGLKEEVKHLRRDCDRHEAEVKRMEGHFEGNKPRCLGEIDSLQRELREYKLEVEKRKMESDQLGEEVERLKTDLCDVSGEKEKWRKLIQEKEVVNLELENKVTSLFDQLSTTSSKVQQVAELEKQVTRLQQQLQEKDGRHKEIVDTYRTHLLGAIQGNMDPAVQQALQHIVQLRAGDGC